MYVDSSLRDLKKSFKEYVDVLEDMKIQDHNSYQEESTEDLQELYTSNIIFESYCNGPIFESAQNSNKQEIKDICKKIRKELLSIKRWNFPFKKNKKEQGASQNLLHKKITLMIAFLKKLINFSGAKLSWIPTFNSIVGIKLLWEFIVWGTNMWFFDPAIISYFNNKELQLRAWQTVCYIKPFKGSNISDTKKRLNKEFKEVLGDKYELEIIKLKYFAPSIRKKEVATDGNVHNLRINNYLLIVNEKGTPVSNNEMRVKVDNKKGIQMLSGIQFIEDHKVNTTNEKNFVASIDRTFEEIKQRSEK